MKALILLTVLVASMLQVTSRAEDSGSVLAATERLGETESPAS